MMGVKKQDDNEPFQHVKEVMDTKLQAYQSIFLKPNEINMLPQ